MQSEISAGSGILRNIRIRSKLPEHYSIQLNCLMMQATVELKQISLMLQLSILCGCCYFLLLDILLYATRLTVTMNSDFICEREAASGMGMLRGCRNPPVAII
jgi:hypothetical protein